MKGYITCLETFGPTFSTLDPYVFQYGATTLLPFPSTIAGALIYAYAVGSRKPFKQALIELVSGTSRRPTLLATTAAVPEDSALVKAELILSRNRFLDTDHMPKRRQGKLLLGKKRIPVKPPPSFSYYHYYRLCLFDALHREYVFTPRLLLLVLASDRARSDIVKRYAQYFSRLGDTESIVTVRLIHSGEVEIQEIQKGERVGNINTLTAMAWKADQYIVPRMGDFVTMRGMPVYVLERRDDSRYVPQQIHSYACPLKVERIRERYQIYRPSRFEAELQIDHYLVNVEIGGETFRMLVPKRYFTPS